MSGLVGHDSGELVEGELLPVNDERDPIPAGERQFHAEGSFTKVHVCSPTGCYERDDLRPVVQAKGVNLPSHQHEFKGHGHARMVVWCSEPCVYRETVLGRELMQLQGVEEPRDVQFSVTDRDLIRDKESEQPHDAQPSTGGAS